MLVELKVKGQDLFILHEEGAEIQFESLLAEHDATKFSFKPLSHAGTAT